MSALEHAVPEKFFNDPAKCNPEGTTTPVLGLPVCPQGISAVKAIGVAASQGQKIYTITKEVFANNPSIVSSNLSALSQSTKQGIQNALNAGMEVSTHERPITQSSWTGAGYTFTDPDTGAGGYIIDGGSNGGVLVGLIIGLLIGIAVIVAGPIVAGLAGAAGLILSQYFNFAGNNLDNLNFNAARFIGLLSGIVLSVILGGYVLISFTPLFVIGLVYLMITVLRYLTIQVLTASTDKVGQTHKRLV